MQMIRIALSLALLATPALAAPSDKDFRGDEGIRELQRERKSDQPAWVPQQNREGRRADAREARDTREWLRDAEDAVREGRLGEANEYLERAATRLLSRSTEPSRAGEPMQDRSLSHIAEARDALMRRDRREAMRQIERAREFVRG